MNDQAMFPVRAYGVFGHTNYVDLEIPTPLMKDGGLIEIERRQYRILSIIETKDQTTAINLGAIEAI